MYAYVYMYIDIYLCLFILMFVFAGFIFTMFMKKDMVSAYIFTFIDVHIYESF